MAEKKLEKKVPNNIEIKRYMESVNVPQRRLAKKLGYSHQTINRNLRLPLPEPLYLEYMNAINELKNEPESTTTNNAELKRYMKAVKVSQWKLANRLGISDQVLMRILYNPLSEKEYQKYKNLIDEIAEEEKAEEEV